MPGPSDNLKNSRYWGILAIGAMACSSGVAPNRAAGSGTSSETALETCDVLAPLPISLSHILGIGKNAAGTIYVGDEQFGSLDRVFVSDGDTLRRQHVSGAGRRVLRSDADYAITFQDTGDGGSSAAALLIQVRAGNTTAMALAPGGSREFITDLGIGNEPLVLGNASTIAGLKIENFPRMVRNVVEVENGDEVVITADMDDTSPGNLRLFYGPSYDLVERRIVRFGQSRGGDGLVDFLVDGSLASLLFYGRAPDGGSAPASLELGDAGALSATHIFPTPRVLPDLTFKCMVNGTTS